MNEDKVYKTFNEYLELNSIEKGGRYLNGKQYNKDIPLVSVITICRNTYLTLDKTIQSVNNQSYPNIEYLIIDGASTDSTLEVIKKNDDVIDFWISESDDGASDALNKGLTICNGDFVFFLNADDFINFDFIEKALNAFDENCDFVFGDCRVGEWGGEYNKILKGDPLYKNKVAYTMPHINQPTIVFRQKCFDLVGLYDTAKKVAPDYDWLVRAYVKHINGKYSDALIAFFSLGGNSDEYYFKGLQEVRASSLKYSGSIFTTNLYFTARCIKRMIKRCLF